MNKKVLYIITKSDTGGAQKYVADLAALLGQEFQTKILYGGKDIKWLSNKVYPFLFFLNDWVAIFELVKTYQKEKPQIIHLNSSKTGVLGAIAARMYSLTLRPTTYDLRPKVIFTAHGWVFNPTNANSWLKKWFYVVIHKIAGYFQDQIICVSEYDYKLALNYKIAPAKKLITIHNGIDPNMKFLEKSEARKEIVKKLNLRPTTYDLRPNYPWIGSIGRLTKEKNYETLIDASALVPNAYFFIIGSGAEEDNLKAKSLKLKAKNLFFINPENDDFKYLKAFDVFVMSSIKEGLPYVLLEAMLAGLPTVVTEAGGMPEIVKNHENGLMVSQKNPEFMAKAIQGLLENPNVMKELGVAAKQTALKRFNLKKMISETRNLYLL